MTATPGQQPGRASSWQRQRRALLLYNPTARRGELAHRAATALKEAGIEVRLVDCVDARHALAQIISNASAIDRVIVAGGDGTIRSAIRGLIQTELPLGVLPLGTANDLARTLGIPEDLDEATRLIIAGKIRKIDVGEVNGHFFFNVASVGISADLAARLSGETKRRWGKLGYAIAATRLLIDARPFHAHILGKSISDRVKTLQIAVGNGRFYGGGSVVQEDAAIDDGQLDLYSLESRRVWGLLLKLRAFRNGRHGAWSEVRTAREPEFTIQTRRPRSVNADGEIVTKTPACFRVRPQAVSVFTP